MKRIFKAACLILLILPISTFSQFPFKGDVVFVPCSPCYNFIGYYAGANAGWKWASYQTNFETGAFTVDDVVTPPEEVEINADKNSFTGGGQIGYNMQLRQFLFGFEGDWNAQSIGDSEVIVTSGSPVFKEGDSFKTKTRWENSYRIRLGYVYRNWLFYGTAGVARINFAVTTDLLPPNRSDAKALEESENKTSTGETVGIGTEYALSRFWSVGLEYRYSIYPGKNFRIENLDVGRTSAVSTPVYANVRGLNTNQLLFKVNFRVYA